MSFPKTSLLASENAPVSFIFVWKNKSPEQIKEREGSGGDFLDIRGNNGINQYLIK
jgi:hypothetical protein